MPVKVLGRETLLRESKATTHAIDRHHCRKRHGFGRGKRTLIRRVLQLGGVPRLKSYDWVRAHRV